MSEEKSLMVCLFYNSFRLFFNAKVFYQNSASIQPSSFFFFFNAKVFYQNSASIQLSSFFSSRLVSVQVVHPYSSIDTTTAWKKLHIVQPRVIHI